MFTDRSKLGVAEIVLYLPAAAIAAFLLLHRHGRPRMAWILTLMFCLMRIATGVVLVLHENNSANVGLLAATIALLGAGVIPLIAGKIGLIRIILASDFESRPMIRRTVLLDRLLFFAGISMLISGGALLGDYKNPHSASTGKILIKVGYIVVVIAFAILISFEGAFAWYRSHLSARSVIVLKGTFCTIPFILVRITYAFLSVFDHSANNSEWSPIAGSVAAFVIMSFLMEYAVVVIYLAVGFLIPFEQLRTQSDRATSAEGEWDAERDTCKTQGYSQPV